MAATGASSKAVVSNNSVFSVLTSALVWAKRSGRDLEQVRKLRRQSVMGEVGLPSGKLLPCDLQGESIGNEGTLNRSVERREILQKGERLERVLG